MEKRVDRMIDNIEDHIARACDCGCVKFNLLKSGGIECSECAGKQKEISWGVSSTITDDEDLSSALRFVGYTNGFQVLYGSKESYGGEGNFYSDTDSTTIIPLYMLKIHDHRIEITTDGEVTVKLIEAGKL